LITIFLPKKVIDVLEVVIEKYNDDRPHEALNYKTPNEYVA
jgi:transposase InsO family protein